MAAPAFLDRRRAARLMPERGLSALVLAQPESIVYATGVSGHGDLLAARGRGLRGGAGRRSGSADGKLPRFQAPNWLVRIMALFDKDVREILGELGVVKRLDATAATRLLGRALIPAQESVVACRRPLVRRELERSAEASSCPRRS
jgi:hypothetical protein